MPFPRPTLTALRTGAMQDITGSDLPNADGFLRRSPLRILAWVQAGLAYLHYGYLDWIARMAVPFTALGEYLEAWAAMAPTPVLRLAPQTAAGSATWNGTPTTVLPSGTIVNRGDLVQYQTTATVAVTGGGTVVAPIVALVPGTSGNAGLGTPLTLSVAIGGIARDGTVTTTVTGGTDLETDPAVRTRMLESYAAPPHGGDANDYVTWSLAVPGVTRAWVPAIPLVPGAVSVFFMMDVVEAGFSGFPQGTNGVAALETRDTAATGDQLTLANALFPKRPVTTIVYAVAPSPAGQDFSFTGLTGITSQQQSQIAVALADLLYDRDSPLADTAIQQSEVDAALSAISGLPPFALAIPSVWPITSAAGSIFTLGVVNYL